MLQTIFEIFGNIIIVLVVICIHELGHLVAGLIQGFRFELFVVGPLGIKREKNKIEIYLNKDILYYGGAACTLPVDNNPENAKKFANLILAGPITSLVLAIILGVLYFSFNLQFSRIIGFGSLASFAIFLATTIPNKTGLTFTDRKRYQRLSSDGAEKEVELAVLRVVGIYGRDDSYLYVNSNDIETMIKDSNYKYVGLFTKLYYQYEKNGYFEFDTENEFEKLSKEMPK